MLDDIRNWLDNVYIATGEHLNRAAMTPEARAQAMASDPAFRRAVEEWTAYVNAVRARQAPGMLPLHDIINGSPLPKRDVQRFIPPAGGVRG